MTNKPPSQRIVQQSYNRLRSRVESRLSDLILNDPDGWKEFLYRLEGHYPNLFNLYYQLYSDRYDFFYHLEELLCMMYIMYFERPPEFRELDSEREQHPHWYQSNYMLGGVCYADLFAGDLQGLKEKIPYFQELGLTYLHIMPIFEIPDGENDGGYAIKSYRELNPELGTIDQLKDLARELRSAGISLVLDLVFNHTADEHEWAMHAIGGNVDYQEIFRLYPNRLMPDAYERHLREIFPEEHPGAFTYNSNMKKWVWTTFHSYQWDLNYANPEVLTRMAEEMLFLANIGTEVLRLDAVAFIWKELGTNCENLPEAHILIQTFNAVARIAAPALYFKSEAIVHPDEVNKYISPDECQLSYNPLIMALLWNSLATREVRLLRQALNNRFRINSACAWVNYVRVHDDIGWTFSDEDAAKLWINAFDHRQFLNAFYSGEFEGSFARGLKFQENPATGDARISGTCASLAGLEKAILEETSLEVELAIRRILLIHGVILTLGGIPLIYLGDEIGTMNDYGYRDDPLKAHDSRWVHRPKTDWRKMNRRHDPESIEGKIFHGLQDLIELRRSTPAFAGHELQVLGSGNDHVLAYERIGNGHRAILFANFSEKEQVIPEKISGQILEVTHAYGENELTLTTQDVITLNPYQFICFVGDSPEKL